MLNSLQTLLILLIAMYSAGIFIEESNADEAEFDMPALVYYEYRPFTNTYKNPDAKLMLPRHSVALESKRAVCGIS